MDDLVRAYQTWVEARRQSRLDTKLVIFPDGSGSVRMRVSDRQVLAWSPGTDARHVIDLLTHDVGTDLPGVSPLTFTQRLDNLERRMTEFESTLDSLFRRPDRS